MGSGVWPLAMATRPAKAPFVRPLEVRVMCGVKCRARPRGSQVLPTGSWRWARAVVLVNQADRAISTGQLRGLPRFHLRPIDVVVFHGSQRDLVLRRVSRLDAFSGYPVRT